MLQIGGRHALADTQNLHANKLGLGIEVEHDTGLNLFLLHDPGIIQPQIKRVSLFVIVHFHISVLSDRSKKAVTTRQGTSL